MISLNTLSSGSEYWLKGESRKEFSDKGWWPRGLTRFYIHYFAVLFFSYLQHAFASSKKCSRERVCWSIPWETGRKKLSTQKSQDNFSDFILIRLGGQYSFVWVSMLDKCPSVRIINKILTDSAETGFLLTIKGRFSCIG